MKPLPKLIQITFALILLVLVSCKKDAPVPSNPNSKPNSYGPGFNYQVPALIAYNGNLIAAHSDTVSQWNGSRWSTLGSALGGNVNAFAVYNGNLIAAGGMPSPFVKTWNGSTWQDLGPKFDNTVNCLIVYNGNLVAGGIFDSLNGGVVNYIAQWNGTSWQKVGPGVRWFSGGGYQINTLAIYNGNLVAGGQFDLQGAVGIPTGGIAQWDGTNWSLLSNGVNGTVNTITEYNGNLFAGGTFVDVIGVDSLKYIAQWTGSSWTTLGTSKIGTGYYGGPVILNLSVYNNNLIVGGEFYNVGISSACGLAQWNGSSWSLPFGTIVVNQPIYWEPDLIYSSTVYNGNLIIGGVFSSVGGVLANNIAQWNGSSWSAL